MLGLSSQMRPSRVPGSTLVHRTHIDRLQMSAFLQVSLRSTGGLAGSVGAHPTAHAHGIYSGMPDQPVVVDMKHIRVMELRTRLPPCDALAPPEFIQLVPGNLYCLCGFAAVIGGTGRRDPVVQLESFDDDAVKVTRVDAEEGGGGCTSMFLFMSRFLVWKKEEGTIVERVQFPLVDFKQVVKGQGNTGRSVLMVFD
ncbi:hypothetical protein FA95DRAFT_1603328 [Auriscalpium vulgare]|uniref:Uncharacterized protein n=1 Tax=Auriscalpium vulgare TaxID=40419 RepID=A0ACB8S3P5_9AGAM|nr:hypothetical protein FA95DRAFT_1603328 [Auriscalpium vulgare]